jgi:lipoyl(octanoyl) transferase
MRTRTYVCQLEKFLDSILARYDVPIVDSPHVGTFTSPTDKIASIGIQIRHRVTSHGFALNVEDDIKHWFNQIVACGLDNVHATTMNSVRRGRDPSSAELTVGGIVPAAVEEFGRAFGREMRPLAPTDAPTLLSALDLDAT